MAKIKVDSRGNVNGNPVISSGDAVEFEVDLGTNEFCLLDIKFKKFIPKNQRETDAASAGTIKIGS
jgi:hypothetical protein